MTDRGGSAQRLIDLTVFLPFGLMAELSRCVPRLVAAGRQRAEQQIAAARVVGKMALDVGSEQVRRRLGEGPATPDAPPLTEPAPVTALRPAVDEPSSAVDDLPIAEYDSLAASQVVARLRTLDAGELSQIERFERANRNRRTVLGKIEQLRRA